MIRQILSVAIFLAGIAALAFGASRYWTQPSPGDVADAQEELDLLEAEIARLQGLRQITPDELQDVLPAQQTMDGVFEILNRAARDSQVGSLILNTGTREESTRSTGFDPPAAPGEETADPESTRTADAVRCMIEFEADFAQTTHFFGLVESARPVMRVEHLDIVPLHSGLRVKASLAAFFYDQGEDS